jgi:Ca2+-binding EF-hand superfamily protein
MLGVLILQSWSVILTVFMFIIVVDGEEIECLYQQFLSLSTAPGHDGGITRSTFDSCLGYLKTSENLVCDRIFSFFDQDGDSIISFEEFVKGLSVLTKGSLAERIAC